MKLKNWLAIGVLLVLVFFVIYEFVDTDKEEKENTTNFTNETGEENNPMKDLENTGLQVGETAPDFTLETLQGETTTLSEHRGKQVILNFWASWCGPCRVEMPDMQKFYEEHLDSQVEVIAVNLTHFERKSEHVGEFVEEFGLTFPIPLDIDGDQHDAYQVITIPTTYFLDENGVVQLRHLGPMTYEFMEESIQSMQDS